MKLTKPKKIHRTTMDEYQNGLPFAGIYVIAYMRVILYVGKANEDVAARIYSHITYHPDRIGIWLNKMRYDWHNIRLDVLEQPDNENEKWLRDAELALIRKFRPLFNYQGL